MKLLWVKTIAFGIAVLVAALFIACSADDTDDGHVAGYSSVSSVAGSVKLACFNVEDFYPDIASNTAVSSTSSWSSTHARVAQFVDEEKIDIIVFVEMNPADTALFRTALVARGIEMTNYMTAPYGEANSPSDDGKFSDRIAIWSRYPIASGESIMQSGSGSSFADPVSGSTFSPPRQTLRASVRVGSETVWFYAAHMATGTQYPNRRAHARALEEYIKANHAPASDNIVICGDLNTTDPAQDFVDSGTIGYLTLKSDNTVTTGNDFTAVNLSILPLPDGYTWREATPGIGADYSDAILDHMILSPALYRRYVSGSVHINRDMPHPATSEHFPIVLQVVLTE